MPQEFKGAKAFITIPVAIAHDKDLLKQPKSILLMGEIVSMLNVTGSFYMSNSKLAERLDCDRRTIIRYLELLEKKELIIRETTVDSNTNAIKGRFITAGPALVSSMSLGWRHGGHGGSGTDVTPLVTPTPPKYNNIKDQYNRSINNNMSGEPSPSHSADAERIPYKQIVDYLNKKAGTHYKATSKATQKLIKARWHEGFTFEDFKKVIDNQALSWQGTEWWAYMRPSTLFNASKFEGYLNANNSKRVDRMPKTGGYEVLDRGNTPNYKNSGPF